MATVKTGFVKRVFGVWLSGDKRWTSRCERAGVDPKGAFRAEVQDSEFVVNIPNDPNYWRSGVVAGAFTEVKLLKTKSFEELL